MPRTETVSTGRRNFATWCAPAQFVPVAPKLPAQIADRLGSLAELLVHGTHQRVDVRHEVVLFLRQQLDVRGQLLRDVFGFWAEIRAAQVAWRPTSRVSIVDLVSRRKVGELDRLPARPLIVNGWTSSSLSLRSNERLCSTSLSRRRWRSFCSFSGFLSSRRESAERDLMRGRRGTGLGAHRGRGAAYACCLRRASIGLPGDLSRL